MKITYTIELTNDDIKDINWVGDRYRWSLGLLNVIYFDDNDKPICQMEEWEAWGLKEEFDRDTWGGHMFFPLLHPRSKLATKLYDFMESIV